jgi:hypothetical protein
MHAFIKQWAHLLLVLALLTVGAAVHAAGVGAAIKLARTSPVPLEVKAYCEPSTSSFAQAWPELRDFQPVEAVHAYPGSDFAALLPPGPVRLGQTWRLDTAGCVKFLKQFHEGATKGTRGNGDSPEGGLAILARYNDQFAVILARFHGRFVLNQGWLTPGQFRGTLVLDRTSGEVKFFRWHVPTAPVNFDANIKIFDGEVGGKPIDPKNPPVFSGGGVLPRMELLGGNPAVADGENWTASISDEAAWDQIEKELYGFRKVEWVAFEQALEAARRAGKPLHVVSIDGTLCDESCCGTGKSLRAGPLSDDRIAKLLNDKCINTWILNSQLSALRDNAEHADARALAAAVLAGRTPREPVDSMVFSPELRLISVKHAGHFLGQSRAASIDLYEDFVKVALEKIAGVKERQ